MAIHYIRKNVDANGASQASKGSIICTASMAGLYPFPAGPIYGATKHGVVGLVRSLAWPLEKEAIQINALAPHVIGEWRTGSLGARSPIDAHCRNKPWPTCIVQVDDPYAHLNLNKRSAGARGKSDIERTNRRDPQ